MFKFGYFINFKALFGVVSTDFPEVVHVKSWKNCEKAYVRTDSSRSLSNRLTSQTHPDSFQIELIHLLYSTCWREGLSCELLLLKKFFHVMFLGEQGWRSGESTRLPPCGPGSIPGLDVICGLSLLLVLFSAPRGFSPGTPVFPSPQKPTFLNSNSIRNARAFNTWALGSGDWATTPHAIELK